MSEKFTWYTQAVALHICNDANDAAIRGFNVDGRYNKATPVNINTAVIVQDGTRNHQPSIDLLLVDEQGLEYVTIITADLLSTIGSMCHA